MVKKKNKEESLVPKDEKTLKMEGVQNLYNFLFEACNILRGPVSQDNFKDYPKIRKQSQWQSQLQ